MEEPRFEQETQKTVTNDFLPLNRIYLETSFLFCTYSTAFSSDISLPNSTYQSLTHTFFEPRQNFITDGGSGNFHASLLALIVWLSSFNCNPVRFEENGYDLSN